MMIFAAAIRRGASLACSTRITSSNLKAFSPISRDFSADVASFDLTGSFEVREIIINFLVLSTVLFGTQFMHNFLPCSLSYENMHVTTHKDSFIGKCAE
jgi:hypothetical protein